MGTRCRVARGLPKEVEAEIGEFLSTHPVRVLHLAQSETHDRITLTICFEQPESEPAGRPRVPEPEASPE